MSKSALVLPGIVLSPFILAVLAALPLLAVALQFDARSAAVANEITPKTLDKTSYPAVLECQYLASAEIALPTLAGPCTDPIKSDNPTGR